MVLHSHPDQRGKQLSYIEPRASALLPSKPCTRAFPVECVHSLIRIILEAARKLLIENIISRILSKINCKIHIFTERHKNEINKKITNK